MIGFLKREILNLVINCEFESVGLFLEVSVFDFFFYQFGIGARLEL